MGHPAFLAEHPDGLGCDHRVAASRRDDRQDHLLGHRSERRSTRSSPDSREIGDEEWDALVAAHATP